MTIDTDSSTDGKGWTLIPGTNIRVKPWDIIEHLRTETDISISLSVCRAEDDPALLEAALANVERARAAWATRTDGDSNE